VGTLLERRYPRYPNGEDAAKVRALSARSRAGAHASSTDFQQGDVMHAVGTGSIQGQRLSCSSPETGNDAAQTRAAGIRCAGSREVLGQSEWPLGQYLLAERCMELRRGKAGSLRLNRCQARQVHQEPAGVQNMRDILRALWTKDHQAVDGLGERRCDSGDRIRGQALAEQAGLSGAAALEQDDGCLGAEPVRQRALAGAKVAQTALEPSRSSEQETGIPGELGLAANPAIRRLARRSLRIRHTACHAAIQKCAFAAGVVLALSGGCVAGLAFRKFIRIAVDEDVPLVSVLIGGNMWWLYWLGKDGGPGKSLMFGEWAGREIVDLLYSPPGQRFGTLSRAPFPLLRRLFPGGVP